MRFLILIMILTGILFAQQETERWGKKEISYVNREVKPTASNNGFLAGVQKVYKFTISDLDGDNCPFHPSCSTFLVEANKQSGFFRSLLMFADRFTRDTNLFKGKDSYPKHESGKFYDPVENHLHYEKYIRF